MTNELESIKEKLQGIDEENVTIVLFGQPGSGKSSLINAVCGREAVKTGEETDTTKDAVVVEHGDVTFIDLPGYGTEGFPEEAFLEKFQPFQYDLFLCVFSDKLRAADTRFFRLLEAMKKPCIFVRNKLDLIYDEGRTLEESEEAIRRDVAFQLGSDAFDLVFVSTRKGAWQGIGHLNDVIMSKMNEARREKYILTAEARTREQLEAKKTAAMSFVRRSATYSAYNGLNPLMVVDMTVDLLILYQMYTCIRQTFGITPEIIRSSRKVSLQDKKLVLSCPSWDRRQRLLSATNSYPGRAAVMSMPVMNWPGNACCRHWMPSGNEPCPERPKMAGTAGRGWIPGGLCRQNAGGNRDLSGLAPTGVSGLSAGLGTAG